MNAGEAVYEQWQRLCALKSDFKLKDERVRAILAELCTRRHGHFDAWLTEIAQLPIWQEVQVNVGKNCPEVMVQQALSMAEKESLLKGLEALMPWRKGPFSIAGIQIDSEWRSDFKYQRLLDLGVTLASQQILDVGTGNGYFLYRLLGSGAHLAVGVDPSWHYFAQFLALQRYFSQERAVYLPMTLDDVLLTDFDITLSMGVLYHRRDPLAHLGQLRETLRANGRLILETLVVDGDEQTVFMPEERYAGMRNVWFLPSVAALVRWLSRLGFEIEAQTEAVQTTTLEQRATSWMQCQSLKDFMQADGQLTKEGLPPPKRVMIVARKL